MHSSDSACATHCPVLYDSHELLIVDKPEGVLSHPNPGQGGQTKTRCAFEGPYDFEARCFQTPEGPVWLIHRLDQDTSGVLLAARTPSTAQKCRELFEKGQVRKVYTALVAGKLTPPAGRWQDTVMTQKHGSRVRSMARSSLTPNAKLGYEVQAFFPQEALSLIRIELMTGKTHQIRVQSAFHRHPVIGDEIYGDFPLNKKLRRELQIRRLFLHASFIEMKHPAMQERLRIEAPLPEKLSRVLERLKRQP